MIQTIFFSLLISILLIYYIPKFKIKNKTIMTFIPVVIIDILLFFILDLALKPTYIEPIAITVFNLEIRYYALFIILGILAAFLYALSKIRRLGISQNFLYTGLIITLPIAIIGARLWYVLFNMANFSSIIEIFDLTTGGLAIQGGVIFSIITILIYSKVKQVSFLKIMDLVVIGFLIGQIFGRIGNFCNHELYGGYVNNVDIFKLLLPQFITENMYIDGVYLLPGLKTGYYQPMFLYEMILNSVTLLAIYLTKRIYKNLQFGDILAIYLFGYGITRTITEIFRQQGEVLLAGNIRVSLLLAIISCVVGLIFYIIKKIKKISVYFKKYSDLYKEVEKNQINTVIFDLDGTLLDTKDLIFNSFRHTFSVLLKNEELNDDLLNSFFGPTLKETFSKYFKTETEVNNAIEVYRKYNIENHDKMVKIYPFVRYMLFELKRQNINVAIVSSKKNDLIVKGLKKFHIYGFIDYIIGSDDINEPKPSPEGINKVLKHFNTKNAVYVGDTKIDIIAGKQANIKTIGIVHKNSKNHEDLKKEHADYIIKNITHIKEIIGI